MLDEEATDDIPHLSPEENAMLTAPFSEKEVYDAILQRERNEAPGPDGFPAEFYQRCWGVIKGDL